MKANRPNTNAGTRALFRRVGGLAILAAVSLAWSGCSTQTSLRYSPEAVAAMSPAPVVVKPFEALTLAKEYVAAHPGTDFMVGSGNSMLPLYKDQTVVVVQRIEATDLKPGMTAVFIGDQGRPVAHVLAKRTLDGWIAMGVGNATCDETVVTQDNLMGVVIRAYQPTVSPLVALLNEGAVKDRLASMP
jgi:hypothetical protein